MTETTIPSQQLTTVDPWSTQISCDDPSRIDQERDAHGSE